MKSKDEVNFVWHCWNQMKVYSNFMYNMLIESEGYTVKNEEGKYFIDGVSTMVNCNLGHKNEEIITAITEQLKKMSVNSLFLTSNAESIKLAKKLCSLTGEHLKHVFYTNSGSEGTDTAIKMARQYFYNKGENRYKVISLKGAYHGCTYGAISACGISEYKEAFSPLLEGFLQITPPDELKMSKDVDMDSRIDICINEVEEVIKREKKDTIAAFIGEPIQLSNTVNIIPKRYWRKVKEICNKYNILLIIDEVATGFGRTGNFFACEEFGFWPDIMILAKGITSGYFPMGAVLVTDEIYSCFLGDLKDKKHFVHGFTTSGHPAGCSASLKCIDIIEREQLTWNSKIMGEYLLKELQVLKNYDCISCVRGKGLMISIILNELTKGFDANNSWSIGMLLHKMASKKGLIVYPDSNFSIIIAPPLNITKEGCDEIVRIMKSSVIELNSII